MTFYEFKIYLVSISKGKRDLDRSAEIFLIHIRNIVLASTRYLIVTGCVQKINLPKIIMK